MNDLSQITPVTFNEATRKFSFELPPSVCDNMLLSYYNKKGITLCHSNKDELENFRREVIGLNHEIEANRNEGRISKQRKMTAALFCAVFICLFVYTNDFFSEGRF
jgi:hypothetical protein